MKCTELLQIYSEGWVVLIPKFLKYAGHMARERAVKQTGSEIFPFNSGNKKQTVSLISDKAWFDL